MYEPLLTQSFNVRRRLNNMLHRIESIKVISNFVSSIFTGHISTESELPV